MSRDSRFQQPLFELHLAYAELTATFVQMDCSEMTRDSESWQEPASATFLQYLLWIWNEYARLPQQNVVVMDQDTVWPDAVFRLVEAFRSTGKTTSTSTPLTKSLFILGRGLAEMLSGHPRFVDPLAQVVQIISYVLRNEVARHKAGQFSIPGHDRPKSMLALAQSYNLFRNTSDALYSCIDKHINQILAPSAELLIHGLSNIFRLALRVGCEDTAPLLQAHKLNYPEVQHDDTVKILVAEWRLEIHTKLLMSSQMQLRIIAAPAMCVDLVEIWNDNHEYGRSSVLRHFSNRLMKSGVIDYILGPTCHPEVTTQSYNIIGFLFASQTVTQEHIDLMWRTATTCQISGVSDSLLAMMGQIATLFSMPEFLRICRKLQTVPIESFTPTIKDFCDKVFAPLHNKNGNIPDLLPYSFMFRLLRESSVPGPPLYKEIQKWASDEIPHLLRRGPSPEDRQLLQKECLKDITEKTRYTLGSIHALVLLYRQSRDIDMQRLILEHELPRLLVDELEYAVSSQESTGLRHAISGPENAPRLQLLAKVVLGPERNALTDELGRKLWELLVGSGAASEEDRDCAWLSLNQAMGTDPGHPFLETCFKEYFPSLPPQYFRPGTLDFVLHKVRPLLSKSDTFVLEDTESSDHAAIEQLWRVALIAPSGTIEQQAIKALVKDVYLENTAMKQMPLHRARNVHLTLVSRCMRQLSLAAKQFSAGSEVVEDEGAADPMVITVDEHQTSEQQQLFTRSLTIVTEFHKLHKNNPRFSSPDLRSLCQDETRDMAGASAELKVQVFDGPTQTDVKPLPIGRLNTAGSLLASIRSVTGFVNYRLYYKGQPLTPSEEDICKSLEDLHIHDGLILVKRESDAIDPNAHVRPGASAVEIEIMRHFDELWHFLGLGETLAGQIYDFLVALPVDEHILSLLTDVTTTYRDIFPIGQPLKSLYAMRVIEWYLGSLSAVDHPSKASEAYGDALRQILRLVIAAISDREVISRGSGVLLKAKLATRLVKHLAQIVTDPLRSPSTADDLDSTLVQRLDEILAYALEMESDQPMAELVIETFNAILETCTFKADLWNLFHLQPTFRGSVQKLLIDDNRDIVRMSTAAHIGKKIAEDPTDLCAVPASALREFFWPLLLDLFPHALKVPAQSLECFHLATEVLGAAKSSQPPELDLKYAVRRIYGLLVDQYHANEIPALALASPLLTNDGACPPGTDRGAFGLVCLLERLLCNNADQGVLETLPAGSGLRLFTHCLFPNGLTWHVANMLWPHGLIFNEPTRQRLNNIVLALAGRDVNQLKSIFKGLQDILHCSTQDEPYESLYTYDLPYEFDRGKEIRAACGYAGLRNLSNTCYLNSLCTQLFMNTDFREFMLSFQVDRRDAPRTLLFETQLMFGRLQSGQQRYVDPEQFVANIKTYDDELININHQMDVEEFFNLLNDRWEAQLRSPEAVRRFRLFYGGQLVTQTKSKECDHISEVMEPFTTIQCDIKGKKDLLESLEAYVNGEHMEGDNKYKCTKCDRHVDAVRRTCLKEIPNALIFHLKRFEFNLRAQSRSKINEYFAFPTRIDMRPYTVQHLSKSLGGSTEDIFVLVGVLVHAGTAESGHYYSYSRERPSSRPSESWFEFNDDNVSSWDPSNLEACCFGGPDSTWDASGVRYEKNHSAYMLFYERASALEKKQQVQKFKDPGPVQVPVTHWIEKDIKNQNLVLLRRHCLFDPDHIRFFNSALERLLELKEPNALDSGECSEPPLVEKLFVQTAIAHLDQVASRTRNAPGARRLADSIVKMSQKCHKCAWAVFEYLNNHPGAFREMAQRCPEAEARRCAADILIGCLGPIRDNLVNEYCASTVNDPAGDEYPHDAVNGVCTLFDHLWRSMHLAGTHRAWPEIFNMMAKFVELGQVETLAFLNHNLFYKTLMVLVAPYVADHERDTQFTKFANFLARRPNRQPCYASVIGLLRSVLTRVTVKQTMPNALQRDKRFSSNMNAPLRLTDAETRLLHTSQDVGYNALVDKLICTNQNAEATDAIFAYILENDWPLDQDIHDTLRTALTPQQAYAIYGPYLRVAEQYCQYSHHADRISQLIEHVARNSTALTMNDGKAVLSFFRCAMDGRRLHSNELRARITLQTLEYLPYWAPVLLAHSDSDINQRAETMLKEKIFAFGPDPCFDDEQGGQQRAKKTVDAAKLLGIRTHHCARDFFVRRNHPVPNSTFAVLQSVLTDAGRFFNSEDDDGQDYLQRTDGKIMTTVLIFKGHICVNLTLLGLLDDLRGLIADDIEDDGSGMLSDSSCYIVEQALSASDLNSQLTGFASGPEWENSAGSSDQADSAGDDDMKDSEF